jgi:hypothetical protein
MRRNKQNILNSKKRTNMSKPKPPQKNVIEDMINKQEVFAVMQYFSKLILTSDVNKTYEIMFIKGRTLKTQELRPYEVLTLKNKLDTFKITVDNEHGKIYEHGDFKKLFKDKKVHL